MFEKRPRWPAACTRQGMPPNTPPSAVLLMTSNPALADALLTDLHHLRQIAVSVETCDSALEMMEAVAFTLVVVDVDAPDDWTRCRRLLRSNRAPVVVLTRFLVPDRCYRRWAFGAGARAYLGKPYTTSRLRRLLARLGRGDRRVELVEGMAYCECPRPPVDH
jgi:CheY-like chemotaxis protein